MSRGNDHNKRGGSSPPSIHREPPEGSRRYEQTRKRVVQNTSFSEKALKGVRWRVLQTILKMKGLA